MSATLRDVAESLSPARLLVVGDLMVDRTRIVNATRLDAQTAAVIAEEASVVNRPGGAAYVAALLRSLGCETTACGVVGTDLEGTQLRRQLQAQNVHLAVRADASRPTTVKERIVLNGHSPPRLLARIDRESTAELKRELERGLLEELLGEIANCDGVLVSDYAKGVCTRSMTSAVIAAAREREIPVVVDPAMREGYARYTGCNVITPNRAEAAATTGLSIQSPADAIRAGRQICAATGAEACLVTLDADGAVLVTRDNTACVIAACPGGMVDATGAGDALAAALLWALASDRDLLPSARFANSVAGLQVERLGTALLTRGDVTAALSGSPPLRREHFASDSKCLSLKDLQATIEARRRRGERIVLTNGCFDLLHPGHVGYLEQAAAEGDCLVVAVNADATVTRLKGHSRPLLSQAQRARMLAALECVDYVVVFDEPTPHALIERLRPDVLVKGGDYAVKDVAGRELVEGYGGLVKTLGLAPGLSTTQLLQEIAQTGRRGTNAG